MKQPKFRGFSYESSSWQNGFGWFETDYTDDYLEEKRRLKQDAILLTNNGPTVCDIESMGQYTGLKDKNGKDIYEGDIVSTDLSRPFLIVEFRNGAFMYQCHHNGQDYYDHMEPAFEDEIEFTKYHAVIGNIYENPELLEIKDE